MKSFRELKFWDQAQGLVRRVHELTRDFPRDEQLHLTAVMRRTAWGITSPLVEMFALPEQDGQGFVRGSISASGQLEYQMLLARDLGYVEAAACDSVTAEIVQVRKQLATHLMKLRPLRAASAG
jgi:four helix bundle protein